VKHGTEHGIKDSVFGNSKLLSKFRGKHGAEYGKTNTLRLHRRQCKIQTMKISFTTGSSEQTERFGEALSKYLEAGTVIALDGDLGAGKT
jgi:hypothetical protein